MTQEVGQYPFPRPSFEWPVTAPTVDPNDDPLVVVCYSVAWQPFVLGAVKQLLLQSTWAGDDSTVLAALERATDLVDMIAQITPSCPEIATFQGWRYNIETNTVQTDFGHTGTWVDHPELDSRTSDSFRMPPRVTDDTQCDAAAGMLKSFHDFIDAGIHFIAVEQIVGALVDFLLLFIPDVGIFIALLLAGADALLSAGASSLETTFTDTVYGDLLCAIYCNINADGTITSAQLATIQATVAATHPGLVSDLFNVYCGLVGVVGFQNSAAVSTLTGDCSECACAWTYEWDHTTSDGGFLARSDIGVSVGFYVDGVGWQPNVHEDGCSQHAYEYIYKDFGFDVSSVFSCEVSFASDIGGFDVPFCDQDLSDHSIVQRSTFANGDTADHGVSFTPVTFNELGITFNKCSTPGGWTHIRTRISGTGTRPAFTGGAYL